MSTKERSFAQHISRQSATSIRQEASLTFKEELDSSLKTLESILSDSSAYSATTTSLMEPESAVDYEQYIQDNLNNITADPLNELLLFPDDDVEVTTVKKQYRTVDVPVPGAARRCEDPLVKECVASFTSDWNVLERKYGAFHGQDQTTLQRRFSSLRRTQSGIKLVPFQEYEVDLSEEAADSESIGSIASIGSAYDLESAESDPLMTDLVEPEEEDGKRVDDRIMDEKNRLERQAHRFNSLFSLFQLPDREDLVETRQPAPIPDEPEGLKILVKVSELKFTPEFEPIFAVLALYDAREKKKISESFCMDMNSSEIYHMLDDHGRERNIATLGRSAMFTITHPHKEIYLVVRLEKVLQKGEIAEATEPYTRELDRKTEDKVRANAVQFCKQLGHFRMPFAWTPIHIIDIISGNSGSAGASVSSQPEMERSQSSNSLGERKLAEAKVKKDPRGSLSSRTGLTLSGEFGKDEPLNISSSFPAVTLTVNVFFRQEADKLSDDHIYRYLSELHRQPGSLGKRLRSLPADLKLDVSPPFDNMPCCLTSSLWPITPYPEANRRPTREIEEFSPKEVYAPATTYKNFLYVYPQSLDARGQSKGQNIGVKVQFMAGENPRTDALQVIYGRSSGPRYTREYWCPVVYHNKVPEFYDEIKIELPPQLTDKHHLLFSFYHISCKKPKPTEEKVEPLCIGYSWYPIFQKEGLFSGSLDLPVLVDNLPPHYSTSLPEKELPSVKWMDGHKPVFKVTVTSESSIHPQDRYIAKFLTRCYDMEQAADDGNVKGMMSACRSLSNAAAKPLVHFLHIIVNNLLKLIVRPMVTKEGQDLCHSAFQSLASVVRAVQDLGLSADKHGRSIILASYIQHVLVSPSADLSTPGRDRRTTIGGVGQGMSSHPGETAERPRSNTVKGSSSASQLLQATPAKDAKSTDSKAKRLLHEQIAWTWVLNQRDQKYRRTILSNSWFFFDVMIKSMAQYMESTGHFTLPRKDRFSEPYERDLEVLIEQLTQEITETHIRDVEYATSLNIYLAFFIHDAFSLMDRGFVFQLIKAYLKKFSMSQIDYNLTELKIQFLRIVCNHEHYVQLNLPFKPSLLPILQDDSPNSPAGSLSSGLDEFLSPMDTIAELSTEFRQHHYLSGLMLSELSVILDSKGNKIREQAIEMLRDLLAAHDNDVRYGSSEAKGRIATIYFPLLNIVMHHFSILFKDKDPSSDEGGLFDRSGDYRRSVVIRGDDDLRPQSDEEAYSGGRMGPNATRNLLICFLWVLKNLDVDLLYQWWTQLKISDINNLLGVLDLCVKTFEYKGRKAYLAVLAGAGNVQASSNPVDVKAQLANTILGGTGTAKHMLRERRQMMAAAMKAKGTDGVSLRKRWGKTFYAQSSEHTEKPKTDVNVDVFIESSLSAECSLIILDTLEELVQSISFRDSLKSCLGGALGVLLQLMNTTQSCQVMKHLFATQRSIVFKFPELLFEEEIEQCAELCSCLMKHCGSKIAETRSLACASLYQLMREDFERGNNFARVKVQVTIALSSIVTSKARFNDSFLRRSLKTLMNFANEEKDLFETTFPDQVRLLARNLNHILSNTVKLQQYHDDIEMYIDLMDRIAKGYQNSPDLRLQWLQHMAEKHVSHKNYAEASMCILHSAALVAEYLYILERKSYLPIGCVSFQKLSPNTLEESAISDDIISPEEEGLCNHKFFSEFGFMGLLEYSAQLFHEAKMFEAMIEVYKLVLPIHESRRNFDKLEKITDKMHSGYQKIVSRGSKRLLGSFFRVGFYGSRFGDLDGVQFIYKEEGHTRLAEFSLRIEKQYSSKIGEGFLVIMKDSNRVTPSNLDPTKGYIQITYVEPYFESFDLQDRMTSYDRTVNVRQFIFKTPFTEKGKAHGELGNQYMRCTILTSEHHFPYVKTRIRVIEREEFVLKPVEVAINDMEEKIGNIHSALKQQPVDMKYLQMQLSGSIATAVNQGPYAIAKIFLSDVPTTEQTHSHQKLRVCFKEFIKVCHDALIKNKQLISEEQKEYQLEMERQYHEFVKKLDSMLRTRKRHTNPRKHKDIMNKISKTS